MAQLIQVHTAPWPHYPKRNVFSDRRNSLYDKSASFRCDGRLFHSPGPAAANTLSLKVLCVRVTTHVRLAVERSRRSRTSATRRQSSARYNGAMPDSDWCMSVATLKTMRWRTGSQCSWRSTGDIWSERRVPVTRRAAAFWTDCSRFISPSEIPKNSELQ